MKVGLRLRAGSQSPVSLAHVVLDAERAGLDFVKIADDVRSSATGAGHASAVWPSLGAIALATRRISVHLDGIPIAGCLHPVGVAHLTLAASAMLPGRFAIGFFTGPSRAVTGRAEPSRPVRLAAIAEAIDVVRRLTRGEVVDQMEASVVINDLRMSGGLPVAPPISLTVTDEHEAVLAAKVGCDLVVPVGTDPVPVVAAYRAAGGLGDIATAIVVRGADRDRSVEVARPLLVDRGAAGDRPVGPPRPGDDGWLADDEVWERLIDLTDRTRLVEEIDRLASIGVVSIELLSVARDPHLAVSQWCEHIGARPAPAPRPSPDVVEAEPIARDLVIDVRADQVDDVSSRPPAPPDPVVSDRRAEAVPAAAPAAPVSARDGDPDDLRDALERALEGMHVDAEERVTADDEPLIDPELSFRLAGRSQP